MFMFMLQIIPGIILALHPLKARMTDNYSLCTLSHVHTGIHTYTNYFHFQSHTVKYATFSDMLAHRKILVSKMALECQ